MMPRDSTPRMPDSVTTSATRSMNGPYMSANVVVPLFSISTAASAAPQ